MEQYVDGTAREDQTRNIREILGMHVLTKSGREIGKVREIRLDADNNFEGIVIRSFLGKTVYICHTYIKELSPKAAFLNIDPAFIYNGIPVITSDGKKFGTVIDIERKRHTNTITEIHVRRFFKTVVIPSDEMKNTGRSILLKKTYEAAKADFTSRA